MQKYEHPPLMKLEMGMQIAMDWNKCSAQENVHMEPNSFRHVVWCGKACMHRTHSRTVPGPLLDTLHIVMRYNPSIEQYDIEQIRKGTRLRRCDHNCISMSTPLIS